MAIGLAALAWLAISVSGLDFSESQDEYQVEARFSNIAGLKPRAKVTSAGVTVGRVASIRLDPEVGQAVVTWPSTASLINFLWIPRHPS